MYSLTVPRLGVSALNVLLFSSLRLGLEQIIQVLAERSPYSWVVANHIGDEAADAPAIRCNLVLSLHS